MADISSVAPTAQRIRIITPSAYFNSPSSKNPSKLGCVRLTVSVQYAPGVNSEANATAWKPVVPLSRICGKNATRNRFHAEIRGCKRRLGLTNIWMRIEQFRRKIRRHARHRDVGRRPRSLKLAGARPARTASADGSEQNAARLLATMTAKMILILIPCRREIR
jgi:hypothetical protein